MPSACPRAGWRRPTDRRKRGAAMPRLETDAAAIEYREGGKRPGPRAGARLLGRPRELGIRPACARPPRGDSMGATICLRLLARHPDLVASLSAHEPPLFGLLAGDPTWEPALQDVQRRIRRVLELLA